MIRVYIIIVNNVKYPSVIIYHSFIHSSKRKKIIMASILGNNEESSIVTSVIEDKSTNNMIKDVLQFLISPNFINQHFK